MIFSLRGFGLKKRVLTLLLISVSLNTACSGFFGGIKRDGDDSSFNVEDSDFKPESNQKSEARPVIRDEVQSTKSVNRSLAQESPSENRRASRDLEPSSSNTSVMLPEVTRQYSARPRTTREDFVDLSQEEGSLWASGGQTNYFFTKNRVRNPGDLISLALEQELYRDILAEVEKNLSLNEQDTELALAQDLIRQNFISEQLAQKKDEIKTTAAAVEVPGNAKKAETDVSAAGPAASKPSTLPSKGSTELNRELAKLAPKAKLSDIDVSKSLDLKVGDSLMGEILERYPNGNYRIRALKKVQYKNGPPRIVSIIGIAKGSDFTEDNDGIRSGRLYEYRVEVAH